MLSFMITLKNLHHLQFITCAVLKEVFVSFQVACISYPTINQDPPPHLNDGHLMCINKAYLNVGAVTLILLG